MSFDLDDNFTGTAATALTAHPPDVPASGVAYVNDTGTLVLNGVGGAISNVNGDVQMHLTGIGRNGDYFAQILNTKFNAGASDPSVFNFRLNEGGGGLYYVQVYNRGNQFNVKGFKFPGGSPIGTNYTDPGYTQNAPVDVKAVVTGTASKTIEIFYGPTGGPLNSVWSYTDASALTATQFGFDVADTGAGQIVIDELNYGPNGAAAMTLGGNLGDFIPTGQFSGTIAAPALNNPAAAPTYKWHLLPNYTDAPGAGNVTGGNTSTLTLSGMTAKANYWIQLEVTDGTTTLFSNIRLARVSGIAPIDIGVIGDSLHTVTGGLSGGSQTASQLATVLLETQHGLVLVNFYNRAVAGYATDQWQPGQTDMVSANTAFSATKLDVLIDGLGGTNDAQSAHSLSTYQTQHDAIIAYALAQPWWKTTARILIEMAPFREEGVAAENTAFNFDRTYAPLILQYRPYLTGLVNGTTIRTFNDEFFYTSGCQPSVYLDGTTANPGAIHPSYKGIQSRAMGIAQAVYDWMYPAAASAVTAVKRISGRRGRG